MNITSKVQVDNPKNQENALDLEENRERKLKSRKLSDFYGGLRNTYHWQHQSVVKLPGGAERAEEIAKKAPTPKKVARVHKCANYLYFDLDSTREHKKLKKANFCRDRFCPICAKNLATKRGIMLDTVTRWIIKEHEYRFIFLTLTAPNVPSDELENSLKRFAKAWNKFIKLKEIQGVVQGFTRKLEITYNAEKDTYHPHYHVLIAVKPRYFKHYYIKRDKWLAYWQKAMQDPSITQVDVRAVKKGNTENAILEICKYTSKDTDYLQSLEVFQVFYESLKGKRALVHGGILKTGIDLYKKGQLKDYKQEAEEYEWLYRQLYMWDKDNKYELVEEIKLTAEELYEVLNTISDDDKDL